MPRKPTGKIPRSRCSPGTMVFSPAMGSMVGPSHWRIQDSLKEGGTYVNLVESNVQERGSGGCPPEKFESLHQNTFIWVLLSLGGFWRRGHMPPLPPLWIRHCQHVVEILRLHMYTSSCAHLGKVCSKTFEYSWNWITGWATCRIALCTPLKAQAVQAGPDPTWTGETKAHGLVFIVPKEKDSEVLYYFSFPSFICQLRHLVLVHPQAVSKLAGVSAASKVQTWIGLSELGYLTFLTCSTNLNDPPLWSPPKFSQISSPGITLLCVFVCLLVKVEVVCDYVHVHGSMSMMPLLCLSLLLIEICLRTCLGTWLAMNDLAVFSVSSSRPNTLNHCFNFRAWCQGKLESALIASCEPAVGFRPASCRSFSWSSWLSLCKPATSCAWTRSASSPTDMACRSNSVDLLFRVLTLAAKDETLLTEVWWNNCDLPLVPVFTSNLPSCMCAIISCHRRCPGVLKEKQLSFQWQCWMVWRYESRSLWSSRMDSCQYVAEDLSVEPWWGMRSRIRHLKCHSQFDCVFSSLQLDRKLHCNLHHQRVVI